MSEEQTPQDQDLPKQDPQPEQTPPSQPTQQNPFQPQSGGFPPNNGGFPPNNPGMNYGMLQNVPNSTLVLVFGIISIVMCCCFYGILGLALGIVALVLANKGRALYFQNPTAYTESSYKNINAGRVCAIIGLVLSALILLASIIFIAMFGFGALNQQAIKEMLQNMQ